MPKTAIREFVLDCFDKIKLRHEHEFEAKHGWYIKSGIAHDCAAIKLLKDHWSTSPKDVMVNYNGVFFSVWLVDAAPSVLHYNVHAKKFREAGYPKIAAREFAQMFRDEAKAKLKSWPSVVYPKGPGTLFQGQIALVRETVVEDTLGLLRKFTSLAPGIDRLFKSNLQSR